jgi:RNA recognition motif-containing protein
MTTQEESAMHIFVGNLPFPTTEDELRQLCAPYGLVVSVRIPMYLHTGRARGFGFVDMPDDAEAHAAIAGLQGVTLGGRPLRVEEPHPREGRRPRGEGQEWPRW